MSSSKAVLTVGKYKISIELLVMTPHRARELLLANFGNRRLRGDVVARYAEIMRRGGWLLASDCIVMDSTGTLIEGQHRLEACVLSDKPFPVLLITDADPTMYGVLGKGVPRSFRDRLDHEGESDTRRLAAVVRCFDYFAMTGTVATQSREARDEEVLLERLRATPRLRDVGVPQGRCPARRWRASSSTCSRCPTSTTPTRSSRRSRPGATWTPPTRGCFSATSCCE